MSLQVVNFSVVIEIDLLQHFFANLCRLLHPTLSYFRLKVFIILKLQVSRDIFNTLKVHESASVANLFHYSFKRFGNYGSLEFFQLFLNCKIFYRLCVEGVKELIEVYILIDVVGVDINLCLKKGIHGIEAFIENHQLLIGLIRGVTSCLSFKLFNQLFLNDSFQLVIIHWT